MKKVISVILCLCLLATGCSKGKEEDKIKGSSGKATDEHIEEGIIDDSDNKGPKDKVDIVDNNNDKQNEAITLRLNKEWSAVTVAGISQPDFKIPSFEPKVDPYVIDKDLSNIENIEQFSGFTKEQIEMISENGFVVLPSADTRMFYVYDSNEYTKVPNFITTDTVLHLYHQFFDKSLMYLETEYLHNYMDILTNQMLEKSITLIDILEDEDMKVLQEKNIIYFLVARMLFLNSTDITIDISDELLNVAKEEYQLIEESAGFIKSPLFDIHLDYSQFTIRGHYTRTEELGRFFRALMWFGTAPLAFVDRDGNIIYNNIVQSLLMSYTTFLDTKSICDAELWNNIYQPTKQFVGASDDINVFMINALRLEVFGDNEDPNIFNDNEYYDKLIQAVKDLPEPKIQGRLVTVSTPTGKQFRYMGQRYILDSYVMQNLMESFLRPLPSALDVMGVLGSETAEELMLGYYKPQEQWPEYVDKYYELKEEIADLGVDTWGENLYNGWLWAIKENLTEYDEASGMPFFMTNDAWRLKSLNASVGSYTELKHDTVLYGKQGVAEGGGDIYFKEQYHYVEPNVKLYSKLLYLTEYTMEVLKERDMLSTDLEYGASRYQELLKILIGCSVKELRNESLTDEEYDRLLYYGANMEGISLAFMLAAAGDYETMDLTDMLVTDIATNPGWYLSLGTGFFDHIYVVVPKEGKLYLARGSVYSSYEFISDKRLTDEEWWELNGIDINWEGAYASYPIYTEPSEHLPKQPDWVSSFKSNENNVEIEQIEVDWELLN